MFRPNSVQRRDGAVEYVIDTVEIPGLFDRSDIGGFFHHANQALGAGCTAAIYTGINIRDVVADGAQSQISLDVAHSDSERFGVVVTRTQDVERKTLGRFASNSWKLFQF